ncbi:MAG TPA: hypothetical protein VI814_12745 [Candidatus Limnocylindria bacterium]
MYAPLARRPLAFLGRCSVAFVEVALAVAVLCGAVVVGHDLRQFREWYGDPGTTHLWAPTPAPSPLAEPLR